MLSSLIHTMQINLFTTNILDYLDSTEGLTPTIGFVNSNLEISNYGITLYDLGGGPTVRNIWKNYYPEVH